jgi:hypothetical protein
MTPPAAETPVVSLRSSGLAGTTLHVVNQGPQNKWSRMAQDLLSFKRILELVRDVELQLGSDGFDEVYFVRCEKPLLVETVTQACYLSRRDV